jgi:hypothetical protein
LSVWGGGGRGGPGGLLVAEGLGGAALLVGALEDGEDVARGADLALLDALPCARAGVLGCVGFACVRRRWIGDLQDDALLGVFEEA